MSGAESDQPKAVSRPRWNDARRRLAQLESSASQMSSAWFVGMTALIIAATLFLASAVVLAGCLVRLQSHFGRAQLAETVLSEASDLQEDLDEGAAAARGFAATKDPRLFQSRESAKRGIRQRLTVIARLVQGDPQAEQMTRHAKAIIDRRMQVFDDMIALAQRPGTATQIAAGETERTVLVRAINAQLATLRDHERVIITEQQRLVHLDIRIAIALVLLTGVVAPACGLIGIHLLRRERDSRRARELQLELMHVQRLGIMGQTAAMLAHELNQPLAAAMNFLGALRRNLGTAPEKVPAMADRIGQQIQRASAILRKLRQFIEKREEERSIETPDVLIDDAVGLLGTIDPTVSLKTEFAEALPAVLVDRVQLQQVLVNLMRNAIEAMQECPRRELTLSATAPDSRTVEISLADTGPGLSKEVAERLFQPFVSTKANGMGVGLSICQTIIAQHKGRIWAEPNPGGGTVFRFTLPAAEERVAA